MATVKISSKGQIVLPARLRREMGLKPKRRLSITASPDGSKIIPEPLPEDPIEALSGIFKDYAGSLAGELMEERRRDDASDEKSSL